MQDEDEQTKEAGRANAAEIKHAEETEHHPRGNVADRNDDDRLTEAPPPQPN